MTLSNLSRTFGANRFQNYEEVIFQRNEEVLDAEVNLVQKFQVERLKDILKHAVKLDSGFLRKSSFSNAGSNQFFMGATSGDVNRVLVNGQLIEIAGTNTPNDFQNQIFLPNAPIGTTRTDFVWLEMWVAEILPNESVSSGISKPTQDSIYKYGNILYGGTNLEDELEDVGFGSPTSNRAQIQYEIRVAEDAADFSSPNVLAKDAVHSFTQATDPISGEVLTGLYVAQNSNQMFGRFEVDENNTQLGYGYHFAIPICSVLRNDSETTVDVNNITDLRQTIGVTQLDPDLDYTINGLIVQNNSSDATIIVNTADSSDKSRIVLKRGGFIVGSIEAFALDRVGFGNQTGLEFLSLDTAEDEIGVNVTDPQARVHIYEDESKRPLYIENDNTEISLDIETKQLATQALVLRNTSGATTNAYLEIEESGTTNLEIDSDGKISTRAGQLTTLSNHLEVYADSTNQLRLGKNGGGDIVLYNGADNIIAYWDDTNQVFKLGENNTSTYFGGGYNNDGTTIESDGDIYTDGVVQAISSEGLRSAEGKTGEQDGYLYLGLDAGVFAPYIMYDSTSNEFKFNRPVALVGGSSSFNLDEIQVNYISSKSNLPGDPINMDAELTINGYAGKKLIIQSNAGDVETHVFEVQNSSGTPVAFIDEDGDMTVNDLHVTGTQTIGAVTTIDSTSVITDDLTVNDDSNLGNASGDITTVTGTFRVRSTITDSYLNFLVDSATGGLAINSNAVLNPTTNSNMYLNVIGGIGSQYSATLNSTPRIWVGEDFQSTSPTYGGMDWDATNNRLFIRSKNGVSEADIVFDNADIGFSNTGKNPETKLDVEGDITLSNSESTASDRMIVFSNYQGADQANDTSRIRYDVAENKLKFEKLSGGSPIVPNLMLEMNTSRIGLNTTVADGHFHIFSGASGATPDANADDLIIEGSSITGINILTPNSTYGIISFGDPEDNDIGRFVYDHTINEFSWYTSGVEQMRLHTFGLQLPSNNLYIDDNNSLYWTSTGFHSGTVRGSLNITSANDWHFANQSGTVFAVFQDEKMGLGTTTPFGKFHIYDGDSGVTAPNTSYDGFVYESDTNSGLSILTPDNVFGGLVIGSPSNNAAVIQRWKLDNNIFQLGTSRGGAEVSFHIDAFTEVMRLSSDRKVGINSVAPNFYLTVYDTTNDNKTILGISADGDTGVTNLTGPRMGLKNTNATVGNYSHFDFYNSSEEVVASIAGKNINHGGGALRQGELHFITLDGATVHDAITINKNGFVGIKNVNPVYDMELGDGTGSADFRILADNTTNDPRLILETNGTVAWSLAIDNSDADKFKIGRSGTVGAATAFTIDGDLKIGIGTSSPERLLTLNNSVPELTWRESDASVDNKNWSFYANSEQFVGQVANDAYTTGIPWITIDRTGTTVDQITFPNGYIGIGTTSGATGKVSINLTSQTTTKAFHVYTNDNQTTNLVEFWLDGAGSTSDVLLLRNDGIGNFITCDDGSAGNNVFVVKDGGITGIGTSNIDSGNKLQVEANDGSNYITSYGANSDNWIGFGTFTGNQTVLFYGDADTNSSTFNIYRANTAPFGTTSLVLRADQNGNIGVGTTVINAKLEVAGSIRGAMDSNTTSYFGRSAIGYAGQSDASSFAHLDYNNQDSYALLQGSSGDTYLNTHIGRTLYLRVNNITEASITDSGMIIANDLTVSGNITGATFSGNLDMNNNDIYNVDQLSIGTSTLSSPLYIKKVHSGYLATFDNDETTAGSSNGIAIAVDSDFANTAITTGLFSVKGNGHTGIKTGPDANYPLNVFTGNTSGGIQVRNQYSGFAAGVSAFSATCNGSNNSQNAAGSFSVGGSTLDIAYGIICLATSVNNVTTCYGINTKARHSKSDSGASTYGIYSEVSSSTSLGTAYAIYANDTNTALADSYSGYFAGKKFYLYSRSNATITGDALSTLTVDQLSTFTKKATFNSDVDANQISVSGDVITNSIISSSGNITIDPAGTSNVIIPAFLDNSGNTISTSILNASTRVTTPEINASGTLVTINDDVTIDGYLTVFDGIEATGGNFGFGNVIATNDTASAQTRLRLYGSSYVGNFGGFVSGGSSNDTIPIASSTTLEGNLSDRVVIRQTGLNYIYMETNSSLKLKIGHYSSTNGRTRCAIYNPFQDTSGLVSAYWKIDGEEYILAHNSSSRRYKEDIQTLSLRIDDYYQLRPVSFRSKESKEYDIGLIAEEVDAIFPNLTVKKDGNIETVRYDRLSTLNIHMIKELKKENDSLKDKIDCLEKKLDDLIKSLQ